MKIKSYIITGPTASGKSDFADALARRIGGVVINADSVQIYRGIENISASPLTVPSSQSLVPYKLFSILPLSEQISVADYLELARREYNAALDAGRPAIFVGGTGFYINALLNGISPMPDISPENRARARELTANETDPQRAARRLEVKLETGRDISEFQSLPRTGQISNQKSEIIRILVNPPADILRTRIAARIPKMIDGGALDEAIGAEHRAIGAASLARYIKGEISREDAISDWITKTNQYAKRQRTWFRTQFSPDLVIDHVPTNADLDILP